MKKSIKFLIILFFSCKSGYDVNFHKGNGGIDKARNNIVNDFVNRKYDTPKRYLEEKGKEFDVFWVYTIIKKESYEFIVLPEINRFITLDLQDSIGKIPVNYFPNNFITKKRKLFLWKDKVNPISKNIIDILKDYGVLYIENEGDYVDIFSPNYQSTNLITIDDSIKEYKYIVPKNNIDKFKLKK